MSRALRRRQPGAGQGAVSARPLPDTVLHARPVRHGAGRGRPSAQPGGAGLWPRRACRACRSTGCASPRPSCGRTMPGHAGDAVVVDLFEPWLEPAGGSGRDRSHDHDHPHRPGSRGRAAHLAHGADRGGGRRCCRPRACSRPTSCAGRSEIIDSRSPADGARLVARAWVDPELSRSGCWPDVNAAAAELGIDAGGIPIRAVANEPGVHNVIVCTLCSCYPRLLLGPSPDWYKARAYRSRVVREPRAVLAEFGLELPAERRRRGARQHGRAALPRAARAPGRHRGLERGRAGRASSPATA